MMRKEAQPRWRKIRFGDSLDLMLRDKWLGQVEPQIADRCRYTTQGGAGVAGSQDEAKRRVLEAAGYAQTEDMMRLTKPQMQTLRDYRDRPRWGSNGVIYRLVVKGLLESYGSDGRYRITDAGRAILDGQSPELRCSVGNEVVIDPS